MTDQAPRPEKPRLTKGDVILIRHGKTAYREYNDRSFEQGNLDLEPDGIIETQYLADELTQQLKEYDEIYIVSSPRARTLGTANVFLDQLCYRDPTFVDKIVMDQSQGPDEPIINPALRDTDIKDRKAFNLVATKNKEKRAELGDLEGANWFSAIEYLTQSDAYETRQSVEQRSREEIAQLARIAKARAEVEDKKVCILVFTHMEVGSSIIREALYPDQEPFPSQETPVLQKSTEMMVSIDPDDPNRLIVIRGNEEGTIPLETN